MQRVLPLLPDLFKKIKFVDLKISAETNDLKLDFFNPYIFFRENNSFLIKKLKIGRAHV